MKTQFHILSFEGPDAYSRAGGIASRITGLAHALAALDFETHLCFVGDPDAPGYEKDGKLHLHRWCQWISRYHPNGVYAGEYDKSSDYAASLPPHLLEHVLLPHLGAGGRAAVLAEEWHTAHAVLHLDWLLRERGLRGAVDILWNANNTFGFDRIDWQRLASASTITTVSRYMKHRMWSLGVDPLVIPNGLDAEAFAAPDPEAVRELHRRFSGRALLSKVARWDPDKRWLLAVDTVGELKRRGARPLLVARGGMEAHGHEVMGRAAAMGLHVIERTAQAPGARGLLGALDQTNGADIVVLRSHLDADGRRTLFRGASAVLANSGHEPFGLVGLETMAAGGVACTGCSGEDYAVPGQNALVLETNDPREFVSLYQRLKQSPTGERELRRAGRATARQYAWERVIERALLPRLGVSGSVRARA